MKKNMITIILALRVLGCITIGIAIGLSLQKIGSKGNNFVSYEWRREPSWRIMAYIRNYVLPVTDTQV